MTIRELLIDLGVDADNEALTKFDRGLKAIKRGMLVAAKAAAGLAAAIGGVTAAGYKAAEATSEYGDRVAKQSKRIGIGVEALQELEHAAQISGASISNVERGFKRLAKTANDFTRGMSTAQDAFGAIGVDPTDTQGKLKDMETIVMEVSEAFAGMESETKKAALAQDLFGRSGTKLVPFLEQGKEGLQKLRKEARNLGIVIGQDGAKASESFQDSIHRLTQAGKGLRNMLGTKLIPVFEGIIKKTTDWLKENRKLVNSGFQRFARVMDGLMSSIVGTLEQVNARVQKFGGWVKLIQSVWAWTKTLTGAVLAGAAAWWAYFGGVQAVIGVASGLLSFVVSAGAQIASLATILWTGGIPAVTAFASGVWAAIAPALPFVAAAAAIGAAVWELYNALVYGKTATGAFLDQFEYGREVVMLLFPQFTALWYILKGLVHFLTDTMAPVWSELWTNVKFAARAAYHIVSTGAERLAEQVMYAFRTLYGYLQPFFSWFMDVTAPVRKAWSNVLGWLLDKFSKLSDALAWVRQQIADFIGMELKDKEQTVNQKVDGPDDPGDSGSGADVFTQDRQRRRRQRARREFAGAVAPSREAENKRRQRQQAQSGGDIKVEGTTVEKIEVKESGDPEKTREVVREELTEHEKRKLRKLKEQRKGGEV